jgi:hypothetical protein
MTRPAQRLQIVDAIRSVRAEGMDVVDLVIPQRVTTPRALVILPRPNLSAHAVFWKLSLRAKDLVDDLQQEESAGLPGVLNRLSKAAQEA